MLDFVESLLDVELIVLHNAYELFIRWLLRVSLLYLVVDESFQLGVLVDTFIVVTQRSVHYSLGFKLPLFL